jgi:hypothetical protein
VTILQKLARMLGVRDDQVEDALQSTPRAREAVQLSRRGFFAAGAVMAATPLVPEKAYSFLLEPATELWRVHVQWAMLDTPQKISVALLGMAPGMPVWR